MAEKIPSPEQVGSREQLIAGLKAKGVEDPEVKELLEEWTQQEEVKVEAINTSRAAIEFNIERAKVYHAGGHSNEALDALESARTQAHQENETELYQQILREMDRIEEEARLK